MYTYDNLKDDIAYLTFGGVETGSIGKSLLGNDIYYVHVGQKDAKQVIITGGIHARENATAAAVILQAYALKDEQTKLGFYFVPMVNPDGALLIEKGVAAMGNYAELVKRVNGGDDFSLWKANARAVDLNVNFDAKFGQGKGNVFFPSPHGYVGKYPFSEPETAALRDFTLDVRPIFTVSYHALGREVYWQFGDGNRKADKIMAERIADFLGYKKVDGELMSAGGYKDWCVLSGIPAVTIEIGDEKVGHPATEEKLRQDIERNLRLPAKITELLYELYESGNFRGV